MIAQTSARIHRLDNRLETLALLSSPGFKAGFNKAKKEAAAHLRNTAHPAFMIEAGREFCAVHKPALDVQRSLALTDKTKSGMQA
jgi:hypothetical protein